MCRSIFTNAMLLLRNQQKSKPHCFSGNVTMFANVTELLFRVWQLFCLALSQQLRYYGMSLDVYTHD